jgi:hypothetical protein
MCTNAPSLPLCLTIRVSELLADPMAAVSEGYRFHVTAYILSETVQGGCTVHRNRTQEK